MVKKKTSKDSWQASLARVLDRTNKSGTATRLAIVGIGNELNGDDAAGVLIIRKLNPFYKASQTIKILEAGQAPENITGAVIRFKPEDILFIDAVSLDAKPGSIHWIDWQRVEGFSASSHSLPLSVVIQYLLHEHACRVHVLGIQVSDTSTGGPVAPEILRSIDSISEFVLSTLSPV